MKKILSLFIIPLIFMGTIAISAQTGGFEDSRVNYIYWDQDEIQTYWTGVTNKISYDSYAPCVGVNADSEYNCGARAYQSQYREYGLAVYQSHIHGLEREGGHLEYVIRHG